ncbi:MAG: NUDIX hydrolase [Nocardioidaceae bacterium]
MDRIRRLPPALVEHARAFLDGDLTPVKPKAAATVVLLRDTRAGLKVYLLRRHRSMAFAAGMHAFPGGTVDSRDFDYAGAWAGPPPDGWAGRLRCDEPTAQALVCAAVRETFEESGVLFAGQSATTVVADTTAEDWEVERAALVDRSLSFADFVQERRLVPRTDLLAAWSHWITPEFEPRRYDTRFFVAKLPTGQRTRDVSGEADQVSWLSPGAAIAGVDSGALAMLAPTYVTLKELAGFETADEAVDAAGTRTIVTVVPGVEIIDGEGFLTLPLESSR